MKTLVILSDTHHNFEAIKNLNTVMAESDYIIHLGDNSSDMKDYYKNYAEKMIAIDGNCDTGSEKEAFLEIEDRKILITHGDNFNVKTGPIKLASYAKEKGCDIVLFGHTHTPLIEEQNGILFINPGCMTKYSLTKTYCYLVIHKEKAIAKIVEI